VEFAGEKCKCATEGNPSGALGNTFGVGSGGCYAGSDRKCAAQADGEHSGAEYKTNAPG